MQLIIEGKNHAELGKELTALAAFFNGAVTTPVTTAPSTGTAKKAKKPEDAPITKADLDDWEESKKAASDSEDDVTVDEDETEAEAALDTEEEEETPNPTQLTAKDVQKALKAYALKTNAKTAVKLLQKFGGVESVADLSKKKYADVMKAAWAAAKKA